MYRISYEKCVCFVFLVILAVLSCSGFLIDNIAMTDISKRNSHTSTSIGNPEFFERLFSREPRHRIRHHRQLRAHHLDTRPTGHIDTVILPTESYSPPSDQIPATLLPTRSVTIRRSQRYSRSAKRHLCQEQDVTRKTYLANTVVLARARSMSKENGKRKENYTVLFDVLQRIKNSSFPVDNVVRLNFSSNKSAMNCETYNNEDVPKTLVKAKIEKSKKYILFLNIYGAHNYTVVGAPTELRRENIPGTILRIANPTFRSKEVKVERLERSEKFHVSDNRHKRLKLVCKVRGFPIPYIHWKRNGTFLHSNSHVRIMYKKRKSTLVIRNPSSRDGGHYQCLARGVDGSTASKEIRIDLAPTSIPRVPCDEKMRRNYCLDGGTCFFVPSMGEFGCVCAEGYSGERCEMKSSNQSSMYHHTSIYTCKIGLFTRYDNC